MNLPELRRVAPTDLVKKLQGYMFDRHSAPSFGYVNSTAWYGINRDDVEEIVRLLNSYDSLYAAAVRLAQMQVKHCYQGMFDLDGVEFCEVCGNVGEVKVMHKSDCPVGQVMSLEGE